MPTYRHRQVFGASGTDVAALLQEMNAAYDAYEVALAEGPGTLEVLAVLYGAATPAAVTGPPWKRYRLAPWLNVTASENPFEKQIAQLQARGARFVVCNHSLQGFAIAIANGVPDVEEPVDLVVQTMRAHLIAGITPVPAGVAAINQAQEAGFTYLPASL